ncbi:hypothetical protein FNF29_04471 [Cafeteria roenbergensis]|uniref:Inosine/uridine-preferring nucleoside hydrolase domain-containing protein n=1 Tax=Cafeteria roenbergensis TaxID=33653 RepID=A0A5A8DAU5_CAFRO|nr:hypothetical protein FNF29_04471 [Cafeteria roenbergensis]KAA0161400.1 hypothetical protein FNF31_03859 [Cafeteria roenbergensis]|eukprot:KAA0151547.1 hypothetical protein FNF29_04471 [Cafeteria roenbergensis]
MEERAAVPIVLDCDPGHDDAMAILLACGLPDAELVLVTTVAGNVPVSSTTRNARRMLHACGRPDIPVVQGASRPLLREAVACHEIHGKTGMDGFDHWPSLDSPVPAPRGSIPPQPPAGSSGTPLDAVSAMADALHAAAAAARRDGSPLPVLVATGPLTNVALLLRCRPDVVTRGSLTRVVIMGGSTGLGNTSPAAEFNIEVDPHAAAVVLEAARPGAFEAEADSALGAAGGAASGAAFDHVSVAMVPLDVTHTAIFGREQAARVAAMGEARGTPPDGWRWRAGAGQGVPAMLLGLLSFFADTYARVFGFKLGPPVHDPCALLLALRPGLFACKQSRVIVEREGVCAGRTVVDVLGVMAPPDAEGAASAGGAAVDPAAAARTGSAGADAAGSAATGAASFRGAAGLWAAAPVVSVATEMDVGAFWDAMLEAAAAVDRVSPLSLEPAAKEASA